MVQFTILRDHLDKVAVARINCICASLNATSQDISSGDNMKKYKNEASLEKNVKARSPDSSAKWKAVRQLGESKLQTT